MGPEATRCAALLRGVNVGGHNKITMADLRRILGDLGHADVVTHLQSGNAVFTSGLPSGQLAADIGEALARETGLRCAVMVRTAPELAAVVAGHPLGQEPENPSRYFVTFLAAAPDPARAAELCRLDLRPERAWVAGREAYLWIPQGAADARLTNTFVERQLGVAGTARNWNTVRKLAELTAYSPV
jgi:uncharacterized protein (DUF1697 family)